MSEVIEKHGLTLFPTEKMSREDWLKKRDDGIGGSDMSAIMGLNHRFPAIELFYQKVGLVFSSDEENEAMFWGSRNENNVLEVGQYYDFDTGEYMPNYNSGNKLRNIYKLAYMVRNNAHPWILGNLDGAVEFDPMEFTLECPAEAKTISSKVVEMWEDGIPPYHIIQIQTYILACEPMLREKKAQIFYLQDGNKFRGFEIPKNELICERILEDSEAFWAKIQKGREIRANVKDHDMCLKYLAEIEPQPDSTEQYAKFLSQVFLTKQNWTRIEGSHDDAVNALAYHRLSKEINDLDAHRQEYKNLIMKSLHNAGANVIEFGGKGRITWNKRLYVNIKPEKFNDDSN